MRYNLLLLYIISLYNLTLYNNQRATEPNIWCRIDLSSIIFSVILEFNNILNKTILLILFSVFFDADSESEVPFLRSALIFELQK